MEGRPDVLNGAVGAHARGPHGLASRSAEAAARPQARSSKDTFRARCRGCAGGVRSSRSNTRCSALRCRSSVSLVSRTVSASTSSKLRHAHDQRPFALQRPVGLMMWTLAARPGDHRGDRSAPPAGRRLERRSRPLLHGHRPEVGEPEHGPTGNGPWRCSSCCCDEDLRDSGMRACTGGATLRL
jgi:hypothetical protein